MMSWLWLINPSSSNLRRPSLDTSRSNRHAHNTGRPSSTECCCREKWPAAAVPNLTSATVRLSASVPTYPTHCSRRSRGSFSYCWPVTIPFPCSSAEAERSFSGLCRLKTYLQGRRHGYGHCGHGHSTFWEAMAINTFGHSTFSKTQFQFLCTKLTVNRS